MRAGKIGIGLIGVGQWGANYVRVFSQLAGVEIVGAFDLNRKRLDQVLPKGVARARTVADLLRQKRIQGVVVAVPSAAHAAVAIQALNAGKHVLCEKPLATTVRDAERIVTVAQQAKRHLVVGHTFLYNRAVHALKSFVADDTLGFPYYFTSVRTNLGPIRHDVDALFDLAPHDISILLHLIGSMPHSVQAVGAECLRRGQADAVEVTLHFPHRVKGFLHVSWIEPVKVRRITAIGSKRMIIFDDVNLQEPIRIFDKGVEKVNNKKGYRDFGEFQMVLREGDIKIPNIRLEEPLRVECQNFVNAIRGTERPLSDGALGLKVVKILEACQASMRQQGSLVPVGS